MMKKLLESVLEKSITELTFLNNELSVKNNRERVKTVDVLVLVNEEFIHIELNANNYSFLHTRNFIYFTTIYGKKTNRGDEFMNEYKEKLESLNEDLTFTSAISYEDDLRMILNTEKRISFEEGIEQGMEQGQEESKKNIIKSMYDKEYSVEQIADIVNISMDEVKDILELK